MTDLEWMDNLGVDTGNGFYFSGREHGRLACMLVKRFGGCYEAAHQGWMRLFQNNCRLSDFSRLVDTYKAYIEQER
jgi:uncharacterized protein YggL (DUF469 family)